MFEFIPAQVPTVAAMGVGAAGLLAGAAFGVFAVRTQLKQAKGLLKLALSYERKGDTHLAHTRALVEPTQSVQTVELFPPSMMQRLSDMVGGWFARDTFTQPDWAEDTLRKLIEQDKQEREAEEAAVANPYGEPAADTVLAAVIALPARRPEPTPEPFVQQIPTVVARAPRRDPEAVPARSRWDRTAQARLGGPIPVPQVFPSLAGVPTRRRSAPEQRRPVTPALVARRLADLSDDTRQFRVKVAA